ncbi:MAG: hypothetical protein ACREC8_01835 [Limisphaerales bacterium]
MKTDENITREKPKSAYSTRITICAWLFLLLLLIMLAPTTVPWEGEPGEWMMALLPIPGIILLPMPILRGTITERIIALILLAPFVWIAILGISALLDRYGIQSPI